MFKPLSLCIGLRYTRSKRSNRFISFISLSSMLGIALGVAVLITVLSVMNGFDEQISKRFFDIAPQVNVTSFQSQVSNWKALQKQVEKAPGVLAAAPYVGGAGAGQALLSFEGQNLPAILTGIDPVAEKKLNLLASKVILGNLDHLKPGRFGIVLGYGIARRLGIDLGDKVTAMVPQTSVSIVGIQPRFKRFTVVGIFKAGSGFGFDDGLAFVQMNDAQKLFQLGNKVSGIHLKIKDIYNAPLFSTALEMQLPEDIIVSNWTQRYGAFFSAVKMEKTMMFVILLLIIAVAVFNLVSSLVMIVNDKQADIAILRTFGALPRTILATFMVQGSLVGIIGTLLGTIGGIALALNATAIVDWIQKTFQVQWLTSNVYFVDYLPSKLQAMDVIHVCGIALLMSFLATIYPAWRASRTQPAEALRYD